MQRPIAWYIAGLLWTVGLYGVLQLQNLRTDTFGGHGVCGPWGCGPPVTVLLACHAFWMALLLPQAILAFWLLPRNRIRQLGVGLVSFGLCGLVAIAGWEAATWFPLASPWQRRFVVQRFLFAIVTNVDTPILQAFTISTGLWIVMRSDDCPSTLQECQSNDVIGEFIKTGKKEEQSCRFGHSS